MVFSTPKLSHFQANFSFQHIVDIFRQYFFLLLWVLEENLHYLLNTPPESLHQYWNEKTCNSIPPYSSPEDDKTCTGIFECYGNMSIIILWYRTQIRRIYKFSTLNIGYFCDVRDKIVTKGTLGSLRTRSSIIKFTFFFH